ncbi:MAG: hypothetical protein HY235_28445 [Acidobacteria bacterium]|nr:hypothetical protein [Acidobacteriota bacterium]
MDLLQRNPRRLILNCSRQWGKSTITSLKAVHHALTNPASLTLILSPTARQSAEFLRKASSFLSQLRIPTRGDGHNDISLLLPNQSRIVGLPGVDTTIRGFSSVSLLLIDEAARVPDELYFAVRPMLAASNGHLWLISTPAGRRGFFYQTWTSSDSAWTRISVPATECPRISPHFLEEERGAMTARFFRQEYHCEFLDSDDAVFSSHLLHQALAPITPLFQPGPPALVYLPIRGLPSPPTPPHFFIGLDLGQKHDYTAIAILERAHVVDGPRDPATYAFPIKTVYSIRYLERLPLNTLYPDIVSHVCRLTRHPSLGKRKTLIVDATGVGQPVVDLLRQAEPAANLIPVVLTGGGHPSIDGSTHRIPRHELLTHLEIAFQTQRLQISSQLPDATTLIHELENLRRKVKDTGDETIAPWRHSTHDDYVFAAALANWRASTS